jgi:hypothetical protein
MAALGHVCRVGLVGWRVARQLGRFVMPLVETLPLGPGIAQWPLWSTTARLVVTDPDALPTAQRIVEDVTGQVELACSRFRPDSEIAMLPRASLRGCARRGNAR